MLFHKNDKIGPYTVLFELKKGQYAETYRVRDLEGKTRFLKLIINSKLSPSQINKQGEIIEIQVAQQLDHPNLCKVLDTGYLMLSVGRCDYFVTEYISSETLSQRVIRDGELSVYDSKQIAIAVLRSLSYLHSRPVPIVHGEVSMPNVLLNLVGDWADLKLIDFGHARFLNQPPCKPDWNDIAPFYLAPECFAGTQSCQSDLFSVGVLLYQLVYGTLPWLTDLSRYAKEEQVETLLTKREKGLFMPHLDKFELDEQLQNCIAKALQPNVQDRFQTADQFIQALEGTLRIPKQSICQTEEPTSTTSSKPHTSTSKKGKGFAAIAGMDDLKQQMQDEIIGMLQHPDEYARYGITMPNGMLLYGPPGCGKTFFAKHFAEEVGYHFMLLKPSDLQDSYINGSKVRISKLFRDAEEQAPAIIFIDEIDAVLPDRSSMGKGEEGHKDAVNEMLAQMDRTGEKGIFIVGATNRPEFIDPAMLRSGRLEKKYYIGPPDAAARKALFELYLQNRPCELGLDYDALVRLTVNYASADIERIVNTAARAALKAKSDITLALLQQAIAKIAPSLSPAEIRSYEAQRAQMENRTNSGNNPPTPPVGFHF